MSEAAIRPAQANALQRFFEQHRTLDKYPTGAYRWYLLIVLLIAQVLLFYDLGFGAILPIWISTLHFTARQFGYFLTCAVVVSGLSGLIGGPLADRHGRVPVIDFCIAGELLLNFANLLITGYWSCVVIRGLMFIVAGLALPATSGLTRDFSPRLGRASGFGLLALGTTASQLLWTFIPGITLPIFHTWQSQVWIMSFIGILLFIPAMLWLKDLHPSLRLSIIESETSAAQVRAEPASNLAQVPKTAREAYASLLKRWEIWVTVIGAVLILTVPITMQTFGPLMFVQAFHYTPAEAAKMASLFFLGQTLVFFPAGYLSDLLRLRKAMSFVAGTALVALLTWWASTFSHPLDPFGLGLVNFMVAALFDCTFITWMAFYSEYLEDIAPALQATGQAFFHSFFRFWLASAGILQPIIAEHYGWGAWIWIVDVAIIVYLITLVTVRGYWGRATATAALRTAPARSSIGRA
jgi:MFS family permease